jgi:hypothetical protein
MLRQGFSGFNFISKSILSGSPAISLWGGAACEDRAFLLFTCMIEGHIPVTAGKTGIN